MIRQFTKRIERALESALQSVRLSIEGPVLSHNRKVAFLILGLTLVFLLFFWFKTDGMPRISDQTDPFVSYLAAENFQDYGLLETHFLEDYATSSSPEAHPYYYTHSPDFHVFWSYLLLKLGIESLSYQNLTAIFILLLGLWYAYKAVSRITNPLAGLCVLLVLATNYLGVLVYGLNPVRVWAWLLIFGTIYHLTASEGTAQSRRKLHLGAATAFYFLTVYYVYSIALLLTGAILLLKVFHLYGGTWKRTILFVLVTAISSAALHSWFVMSTLGFEVWFDDLSMTLTNRAFGYPARATLQEFYSQHFLVLWGYPEFDWTTVKWFFTHLLPERIKTSFGSPVFYMAVAWTGALLIYLLYAVPKRLVNYVLSGKKKVGLPSDKQKTGHTYNIVSTSLDLWHASTERLTSEIRLIAILAMATLAVCIVLPGQVMFVYIGPFCPFFVIFLAVMHGLTIWTLVQTGLLAIEKRLYIHGLLLGLGAVLLVGSIFGVQWQNYKANPPQPFGSAQVLDKYRGYSSVTNFQSPYVRYFTKEWVTIMGWHNEPIRAPFKSQYTHERDKFQNPKKYEQPDYIILQEGHNQPLHSVVELIALYDVVDDGDDYVIFKVQGSRKTKDFVKTGYDKVDLAKASLEVSSVNKPYEDAQKLIDGRADTYWHVKHPPETDKHQVTIDLGTPERIEVLGLLPREGHPEQFWQTNRAIIEGSNDKEEWFRLSTLAIWNALFDSYRSSWLYFPFYNPTEYRYYRISIADEHFLSCAELELYGKGIGLPISKPAEVPELAEVTKGVDPAYTKIDLTPSMIEVSTAHSPHEDKAALIDDKLETHWHVKHPPETDEHWLVIDLGTPKRVEALIVVPTPGRPEQSWNGDHATIQGSNDRQEWLDIARLPVEKSKLDKEKPNWLHFSFQNIAEYRYYRILIRDKFFLSIAELELYERAEEGL